MMKLYKLMGVVLIGFAYSLNAYAGMLPSQLDSSSNSFSSGQVRQISLGTGYTGTVANVSFYANGGGTTGGAFAEFRDATTQKRIFFYTDSSCSSLYTISLAGTGQNLISFDLTGKYQTEVTFGSACTSTGSGYSLDSTWDYQVGLLTFSGAIGIYGSSSDVISGVCYFPSSGYCSGVADIAVAFNNPTFSPPAPTSSSISLVSPISVTLTQNPVDFVTTQTRLGTDTCFKEIQYQVTASSSLQDLYIPSYAFNSCPSTSTTDYATTTATLPVQGNYMWRARLASFNEASSTAWSSFASFSLGTTTMATSTNTIGELVPVVCNSFDFGCYIRGAFLWAFYPSAGLATSYNDLLGTIQSKPPIGYFTILKNSLGGLNASSTPVVSVTLPSSIRTRIFSPFDVALASILWFFFATHFYRRLKTITI